MHEFALYGKRHFSLANYKSQCVSMLTQPDSPRLIPRVHAAFHRAKCISTIYSLRLTESQLYHRIYLDTPSLDPNLDQYIITAVTVLIKQLEIKQIIVQIFVFRIFERIAFALYLTQKINLLSSTGIDIFFYL